MDDAVHDPASRVFEALVAAEGRVLITGPVGPDGDSVGACLAFARVLRDRGARVVVAGDLPARYRWMPGAGDIVADAQVAGPFAAAVVLDGDRHRLPRPIAPLYEAAPVRAIVDHHGSTDPHGYSHAWLEPRTESTTGMLLRAFRRWGLSIDRELAELLYTGLVFDTGGFRHANTGPETHRLAAELVATGIDHATIAIRTLAERSLPALRAMGRILADAEWVVDQRLCLGRVPVALQRELGLVDGDLEGVVDALINTDGTEIAALLIARPDNTVKYSLRSRSSRDVAALARVLHPSGGGHPRAAGALVAATLADAEAHLLAALRRPPAAPPPDRTTPTAEPR